MNERREPVGRITGVAASEGVAMSPTFVHIDERLEPEREKIPENAVEAMVQWVSETG